MAALADRQAAKQRSRQTAAIGRAWLLGFPGTLLERALMDASGRWWTRMGLSDGQSRRLGSAGRRRTRAHLSPLNHCKHTRPKLTIRYRRWWVRPLPVTAHEASNVAGCHCVHIMTSLSPARRPALVSRRRRRHGLAAETLTRCANMGKPSCVRRPVSALYHVPFPSITTSTPIPLSLLVWLFPPPASAALAHGPGILDPPPPLPVPVSVYLCLCLLLAHS
jgi:hypothetical protein